MWTGPPSTRSPGTVGPYGAPPEQGAPGWGGPAGVGPGGASLYGSPPPGAGRGLNAHTPLAKQKDDALKSVYIGVGVMALFAFITIGSFIVAPGGRFFILFGPILIGGAQIKKGIDQLGHVKRIEREAQFGGQQRW